ncbi:MAG: hypothetical protein GY866_15350 [Proteobacteria bacterium]|nr:hypothetical protein [Pseudomonadota bacterium]
MIAFFASPHGFGHAARSAAIMSALHEVNPSIRFEIFTLVPEWFFRESLSACFVHHSLATDVGLVQANPLQEDLPATLRRLDDYFPLDPVLIANLAEKLVETGCDLVVCDIAPLGIEVARKASLPSVLVENFTWDWIYQGYVGSQPGLEKHIRYLGELFDSADYRIQAEPVCQARQVDLTTSPISRKARKSKKQVRKALGIPAGHKFVVVTMGGGIQERYAFLEPLTRQPDIWFVVPGGNRSLEIRGNIVLLPYDSNLFHPDLINAADAVIGKVGYSTLAEIYRAGVPFGYIPRPEFRESPKLVSYIETQMTGIGLSDNEFRNGDWTRCLPELLDLPGIRRTNPNGADQAAAFLQGLLSSNRRDSHHAR